MICDFCNQRHGNEGDRYGCPRCHGEGLDDNTTKRPYAMNDTTQQHPSLHHDHHGMTSLDWVRHWENVCADLFDETRLCAFDASVQRDLRAARAELSAAVREYQAEMEQLGADQ